MTKTVYAYAADGKYIGERTLDDTDRSPISGAWQIPGNMTETKPPKGKEGYDIYWNSGKWDQVERPKPELTPTPPEDTEPQGPYIDPERLAAFEAMAAQEERLDAQAERIAALEAALKGGGKK
jgi:hypothetical protein|nr:MAG TPA: hypothetical protein [Caudoviricetes sp.]